MNPQPVCPFCHEQKNVVYQNGYIMCDKCGGDFPVQMNITTMVPSKPPRDPARIEPFLAELRKVWEQSPDLRFSQLIINICHTGVDNKFYLEDEDFSQMVKDYARNRGEYHERKEAIPSSGNTD